MRLEELYPYWSEVHDDLMETLSFLTEEQVTRRPHDSTVTIRQMVFALVRSERYYIGYLAAGLPMELPAAADYTDGPALAELLRATREATNRAVAPLTGAGLKAVRTVPADAEENRPETNMPIAWLIWYVLREEIACYGQISLRRRDEKSTKQGRWNA